MIGITCYGAYVPRLRLSRAAAAQANAWANPTLLAQARGERSMANWDEDSLTMAVEAARDALAGRGTDGIGALYFGSTTHPFADRQNAGLVAAALDLPESISDDALNAAVELLIEKYDRELVAVYLTAFNASNENRWGNLDALLAEDERLQFHG